MSRIGSSVIASLACPLMACASRVPGVEPSGDLLSPMLQPTLCSTMSAGMDFAQSVSGWREAQPTLPFDAMPVGDPGHLMSPAARPTAYHLSIPTEYGDLRGWYTPLADSLGLVVYFTGLGQSADGELALQIEHVAVGAGWSVLRVDRDDTIRPVRFDPMLEATRAVAAARHLSGTSVLPNRRIYVGVSMGGMEGALAARMDNASVFVGRDPLLSPQAVARWLDEADLRRPDALQMKKFFQRMMCDRYDEPCDVRFEEIIGRSALGLTDLQRDAPSRWLCDLAPEERWRFHVEVSTRDPALGPGNAAPLVDCGFPLVVSDIPGHVPVACEPWALDALIERGIALSGTHPDVRAALP